MTLKADEVVAAGIGCYDDASLEANVAIVSTTGDDPVNVCTEMWNRGDLGRLGDAPAMKACVNEPGGVLVFPNDDQGLCTRFGLQNLPKNYEATARRFAQMRDALSRRIYEEATAGGVDAAEACLDEETALSIARAVLDDHGFDDWGTEVATGDYAGRTCANHLGFEDAEKTLLIIPSYRGIDPDPSGSH